MKDLSQLKPKTKALAYIVRRFNDEIHLLIFAHRDFPNAGLQVPGGTIKEAEQLQSGILREVKEESGLSAFNSINYLGKSMYVAASKQEIHERHFFQLNYVGEQEGDFSHEVTTGEEDKGLLFLYQWIPLSKVPKLAADQDCMLEQIATEKR